MVFLSIHVLLSCSSVICLIAYWLLVSCRGSAPTFFLVIQGGDCNLWWCKSGTYMYTLRKWSKLHQAPPTFTFLLAFLHHLRPNFFMRGKGLHHNHRLHIHQKQWPQIIFFKNKLKSFHKRKLQWDFWLHLFFGNYI